MRTRVLAGAKVAGVGAHRPALRVDNIAIAERTESSDAWIRDRSGIVTRGVAAEDESVVDMATIAGGKALAAAGVDATDLGLVLLATCSMPGPLPGGSPEVAYRLGASNAGASDVGAGCAGFAYALGLAADAVRTGTAEHVLVIGSEKLLPMVDHDDRGTAFLFGDGAGAAVVSRSVNEAIGPVVWAHDGDQHEKLTIHGSPPRLAMEGRSIFRWATTSLPDLCRRACVDAGIELADLKAFVPHQANLRITESVVKALGLPETCVVARDVVDSGNTSAASIPLALARLLELGEVKSGDPVLLFGFGAGLTAAGQVIYIP
ncbi:MAG: 3-oxoacyl-(acyl-carrier-protein) synthase 3 [Frankiales bacterium]|nr:3-oxoacyl-(acyl-carrier-protein) synthase 3 [Frankiales bacterium]